MERNEWQTDDTISNLLTQRRDGDVVLAGRFKIVRKLGEGGMGSVWLAEDMKLDGRQVAIKMLPVVLATSARAVQQLKAEAKVAMQLSHANIVILRSFEDSDEGAFLVMDYVPGKTLEQILAEKGTLSEDEVLRIFKPIAEALDHAHRHKVVHRDVKPSNIILNEAGEPFIMDFGIAREMKDTMTRVTGKNSSGTLPYMSPEQLRGEDPAPAQDVYSLAATIYECLTGHPPFHRGQIEHQIEHMEPKPLASHSSLARAVMAGLEKMPEDRPATAGGLVEGKDGFPQRAQSLPRPGRGAQRSGRGWKWVSWAVVLAGVLAVAWNFTSRIWNNGVNNNGKKMVEPEYTATTQLNIPDGAKHIDLFSERASMALLSETIRNLNLRKVWGEEINQDKAPLNSEVAINLLKSILRIEQDPVSGAITIKVTTKNSQRSKEIANEYAAVCRDRTSHILWRLQHTSSSAKAVEGDQQVADMQIQEGIGRRADAKPEMVSESTTGGGTTADVGSVKSHMEIQRASDVEVTAPGQFKYSTEGKTRLLRKHMAKVVAEARNRLPEPPIISNADSSKGIEGRKIVFPVLPGPDGKTLRTNAEVTGIDRDKVFFKFMGGTVTYTLSELHPGVAAYFPVDPLLVLPRGQWAATVDRLLLKEFGTTTTARTRSLIYGVNE